MIIKTAKYISVAVLFAAGLLLSCKDEKLPLETEAIAVSRSDVTVDIANTVRIGITSGNGGWTISGDMSWCVPDPLSGGQGTTLVLFTIDPNPSTTEERSVTFTVSNANNDSNFITITQLPDGQYIPQPDVNPEYNVNKELYDILKEWYLWNGEVKTAATDFDQNYSDFVASFLKSLSTNDMDGGKTSSNVRYLYSYAERFTTGTTRTVTNVTSPTFGMGVGFGTLNGTFAGRILYVAEGSAAAQAGLKRGDWFRRVTDSSKTYEDEEDNKDYNLLTSSNYLTLCENLISPKMGVTIKLGMASKAYDNTIKESTQTVSITARQATYNPVFNAQVFDRTHEGGTAIKVGYLMYNSFLSAYESSLVSVFDQFKAKNVTDLILDLRYNQGGEVATAHTLANLIAPASAAGKTFATLTFNSDKTASNQTLTFDPHASGIGVTRLYIIATNMTASASEMIINGFSGIKDDVQLVLLGGQTEGKNVGMSPFKVEATVQDVAYTYMFYPVTFKCANALGNSAYSHGLSPNGQTIDEWLFKSADVNNITWYEFGNVNDAMLAKALQYAVGSIEIPSVGVSNAASRSAGLQFSAPTRSGLMLNAE